MYWTLLNTVLVFSAKREGRQSPSHFQKPRVYNSVSFVFPLLSYSARLLGPSEASKLPCVRQFSPCVRQLFPQEAGRVTWPYIPLPGSSYFLIFPFDV